MFGVRAERSLTVLVTAQWKHHCSLEEQGRNKCFSHAINNVAGKDVVKAVLWVLPGGMFSFLLSFFFFYLPPQTPFIQSDTEHLPPGIRGKTALLQGKEKIKQLKLNKSIPVGKGQKGGVVWPGWALGNDWGLKEREDLLEEASFLRSDGGVGRRGCEEHWRGRAAWESGPFLFFS